MRRLLITVFVLMSASAPALAQFGVISPASHEPVKFSIQDDDPAHFTINLKKIANLGVNQDAKTYALYNTATVPDRCGNFLKSSMDYQKPDKYHRIFDLRKKPEVLAALNQYGCVIIPNKPRLPPAKS